MRVVLMNGHVKYIVFMGIRLRKKGHNHKYYKDALEKEIEWWDKQIRQLPLT